MKRDSSFLIDSRIVQRNITDGRLTREEYEASLNSLPDLEGTYDDISSSVFTEESHRVALTGEYMGGEEDSE